MGFLCSNVQKRVLECGCMVECVVDPHGEDVRFTLPRERASALGVLKPWGMLLMTLRVEERHRGRGAATFLLRSIARWCQDQGVERIDVDDVSDRQGMERNVYKRAGFAHLSQTGTEMCATPGRVLQCTT